MTTIGGAYETPIDLAASNAAGKEILDETSYNSKRLSGYFRLDTKYGFRFNSSKHKVTNQQNVLMQNYNAARRAVGTIYQIGFFPDILYKISF